MRVPDGVQGPHGKMHVMSNAAAVPDRHVARPLAGEGRGEGTRAVAIWLLACCALLFALIVVGGVTRLTHSGL